MYSGTIPFEMANKKTLFMETTDVPAERTAAEISSLLAQSGARQIAADYEAGNVRGLRWTMRAATPDGSGRDLVFAMPVRVDPVYKLLRRRCAGVIGREREERLRAQADRVAWRQLLRWMQAQLALTDCGMVETVEVFLPYWMPNGKRTLFEELAAGNEFKRLPAPEAV